LQKEHRIMQVQAERIASLEEQTSTLERQNAELATLKAQVAMLAQAVERADKSQMLASTR
jgi:cell shape-determining protein MreC